MRQVRGYRLWIGNPSDTCSARAIIDAGVEAVIELADNEPGAQFPRQLVRGRFPLADGGENPTWLLLLAADTVAALLQANVPVLVCCSGGMNRSVCIAAAGIALAESRSLVESLMVVVEAGPADVSPMLLSQLERVIGRSSSLRTRRDLRGPDSAADDDRIDRI